MHDDHARLASVGAETTIALEDPRLAELEGLDGLRDDLRAQVRSVDEEDGARLEVRQAIHCLAKQLPGLLPTFRISGYVRSLARPGSAQAVVVLADEDGEQLVLKAFGTSAPQQADIQRAWGFGGVGMPVPFVRKWGEQPCSWVLMDYVDAAPLADHPLDDDGLIDVTRTLARELQRAYLPDNEVTAAGGPVEDVVSPAVRRAVASLQDGGHDGSLPEHWERHLQENAKLSPRMTVHGDLSTRHVLRHQHGPKTGKIALIDPCGYSAHRAFDTARWVARSARPHLTEALFEAWNAGVHDGFGQPVERSAFDRFLRTEQILVAADLATANPADDRIAALLDH